MVDIERLKKAYKKAGLRDSGLYYNRDGEPIGHVAWVGLFEDPEYRLVAQDKIGPYRVSTIWLGIDHGFGRGKPIIFETMVFGPSSAHDIDGDRYHTLEEARAGHERFVTIVRATWQPLPGEQEPDREE